MNTLLEKMTKTAPTFIFVDGSYYNFYRYHSLLTWWKNAFPEDTECLLNPYQNPLFLEKFKKTFVTNIKSLQKNLKIDKLDQMPGYIFIKLTKEIAKESI